MSIEDYEKAIGLLKDRSIDIFSGTGVTDADIVALEAPLGVRLPPSYKAMLTQFGTLSFEGIEVYGWTRSGLDGKSIPNVVFVTEDDRKRGLISDQMVNFMVAGYGSTFVLDCAEISAGGEHRSTKSRRVASNVARIVLQTLSVRSFWQRLKVFFKSAHDAKHGR